MKIIRLFSDEKGTFLHLRSGHGSVTPVKVECPLSWTFVLFVMGSSAGCEGVDEDTDNSGRYGNFLELAKNALTPERLAQCVQGVLK